MKRSPLRSPLRASRESRQYKPHLGSVSTPISFCTGF
jgi:hypothetical protein